MGSGEKKMTLRRIVAVFAAVFALCHAGFGQIVSEVPLDEEDPYVLLCGQADQAVEKGQYSEAATRLLEAMAMRPDSPQNVLILSNLGMIYSYMNEDSLAIATLNEALSKQPALKTARLNRAKVFLKIGRDSDAYADFGTLLETDSLNAELRYYHGTIALYKGNREQANRDYAVLEAVEPEGFLTAQAMGVFHSLTGNDAKAIPYLKKVIEQEPAAEYYAALAGCLLATGELAEASAILREAMEAYPSDPELYYYRARLNKARFLLDDAHADADRAVALGLNPKRVAGIFK